MSTTRTIGLMSENGDKRGVLYSKTFFVLSADKISYTPIYKQTGSDTPFLFPADTYIYDWEITAVSDHYLIVVNACDDDFDWGDDVSQLSGCIDQEGDRFGTIYTAKYILKPADKQTYIPTYGINGDTAPFGFPADTYIFNWKVESSSDQVDDEDVAGACGAKSWIITIQACNDEYDWRTGAHRVGEIAEYGNKKGVKYSGTYFVPVADKATYTPTYQQDGSLSPFGFPASTYIYEWNMKPVYTNPVTSTTVGGFTDVTTDTPAHYIVTVGACDNDYDWDDGTGEDAETSTKVLRSFGIGQIFFELEWYGMLKWENHTDYAAWKEWYMYTRLTVSQKAEYIDKNDVAPHAVDPPLLAFDDTVIANAPGDIVYKNALPGAAGTAVASETAKLIWYSTVALLTHKEWAGQNVQTVTYTVEMYRNSSTTIESYIDWQGVNGGFSPPAGCAPTGYTGQRVWRSLEQHITENAQQFSGVWYSKIIRKMEKAPDDMLFRAEVANGPVWTW